MSQTDSDLRNKLTTEQYYVTQEKGTEPAFSGEYDKTFDDGTYHCVVCGAKLFKSENKYDSGCGWPSFDQASDEKGVAESEDLSREMIRTEVICNKCGAHLGHVFDDDPKETTGKRYCINSVALKLEKR